MTPRVNFVLFALFSLVYHFLVLLPCTVSQSGYNCMVTLVPCSLFLFHVNGIPLVSRCYVTVHQGMWKIINTQSTVSSSAVYADNIFITPYRCQSCTISHQDGRTDGRTEGEFSSLVIVMWFRYLFLFLSELALCLRDQCDYFRIICNPLASHCKFIIFINYRANDN